MLKKTILASSIALLTACGGGGGGGSDGGGSPGSVASFPDSQITAGSMKSAASSSITAPCPRLANPEDAFYESANFQVFGEPGVSEKSLKIMATLGERGLTTVVNFFGLSHEQLRNYAPFYNRSMWTFVRENWMTTDGGGEFQIRALEGAVIATGLESDYGAAYAAVSEYWESLSKTEQSAAISRIESSLGRTPPSSATEWPEKYQICLEAGGSGLAYAQKDGFIAKDPSIVSEYNKQNNFEEYGRIVAHELVHTAAEFIIPNSEQVFSPSWFSEGLAEYATGGEISNDPGSYNFVRTDSDAGSYADAARVVQYIVEDLGNGRSRLLAFLLNIRNHPDNFPENDPFGPAFSESFEATFYDIDTTTLTIDELADHFDAGRI